MRRQVQRYGKWLAAIAGLALVAVVCGGYILVKQRLSLPFQDRYTLYADFQNANGLTPGLGQAVNVSGVRVGTILGVEAKDGIAHVEMEIDPEELPREKLRSEASATLMPNTPLQDMVIELAPGRQDGRPLPENATIPAAATTSPIGSDELTAALDADTRDYFELLVASGAEGLRGRGRDLRELFKALGPTARNVKELSGALAQRRRALSRMVHSLGVVATAVGERDGELTRTIEATNTTLASLASQESALRVSLRRLPGTLAATSDALDTVADFSEEVRPTAEALTPVLRRLPQALDDARPLLRDAVPILRTQVRPLVRGLRPLAADLTPAAKNLSAVTPELSSAFRVLGRVVNELAYNPPGDNEGFLFWTAWFAHNGASFLSTADANGSVWRGLGLLDCGSLAQGNGALRPLLTLLGPLPTC